jgi:hypothetical protein
MNDVAPTDFDYGQLGRDDWKLVQDARDEIKRLGKQTVESIVEIGRLLIEVKARLPHGQWLPRLKAEFAWSESTARRFMDSYELCKSTKLEDLPTLLELPPSAVAELAARSTPPAARQEIMQQIVDGARPTTQRFARPSTNTRSIVPGLLSANCTSSRSRASPHPRSRQSQLRAGASSTRAGIRPPLDP